MAVITPIPKTQFIGADGIPLVGGKVYTYQAGTTSPQVTYTDSTGSEANTNPIILDSRGEANIWLGEATYKFKLTDSNDVEQWTVDYISAPTTAVSPVLTGNVTISTDSSGPALKVTQTGTGDVMRVQDSVDPDLTPFVINSAGLVGLGTVAPAEALDIDNNGKIQFSANGTPRTVISADATNSTFDVRDNRNFVVRTNGGNRFTVSGSGAVTFTGAVTFSGGVAVTGNSTVTGTLGVSGALTVSSGGAAITGNSTVTGTLGVSNALTVSAGGATITGNSSVIGTLTSSGALTVSSGGAGITGNSSVTGTLGVSAATTLSSTLDVTSAATFLSTMSVSANVTAATAPTLGGHLTNKTYVDGQTALKLNLSGGTMTGNLAIINSTTEMTLTLGSSGGYFYGNATTAGFKNSGGTARVSWNISSGDFTAAGNVTAYSDARLKTNVKTIENALELTNKMRGVFYDRIDTGVASVGVIAQEMQAVLPQVVVPHEDKLTVAYGNIVGVLIEAVKELTKRVEELERK